MKLHAGALNSDCKLCILMGRINNSYYSTTPASTAGPATPTTATPTATPTGVSSAVSSGKDGRRRHADHSLLLVPMDSAGLKVVRALNVMGFDDAPRTYGDYYNTTTATTTTTTRTTTTTTISQLD